MKIRLTIHLFDRKFAFKDTRKNKANKKEEKRWLKI